MTVRINWLRFALMMKFAGSLILIFGSLTTVFAGQKNDTITHKSSVKLDFVPLYHVILDNRVQIRAGLEYERYLHRKQSVACYLDMGLYDKYNFIKYYDFFGQNQPIYSISQKVSIAGFHLLPSYNY